MGLFEQMQKENIKKGLLTQALSHIFFHIVYLELLLVVFILNGFNSCIFVFMASSNLVQKSFFVMTFDHLSTNSS